MKSSTASFTSDIHERFNFAFDALVASFNIELDDEMPERS